MEPKKSNKMIGAGKFLAIAVGTAAAALGKYVFDWWVNRKKKPVETEPETPEEKPE